MDPLTMLQVAVKNNVGVFYFSSLVPVNVLLIEDGRMGESMLWWCIHKVAHSGPHSIAVGQLGKRDKICWLLHVRSYMLVWSIPSPPLPSPPLPPNLLQTARSFWPHGKR